MWRPHSCAGTQRPLTHVAYARAFTAPGDSRFCNVYFNPPAAVGATSERVPVARICGQIKKRGWLLDALGDRNVRHLFSLAAPLGRMSSAITSGGAMSPISGPRLFGTCPCRCPRAWQTSYSLRGQEPKAGGITKGYSRRGGRFQGAAGGARAPTAERAEAEGNLRSTSSLGLAESGSPRRREGLAYGAAMGESMDAARASSATKSDHHPHQRFSRCSARPVSDQRNKTERGSPDIFCFCT